MTSKSPHKTVRIGLFRPIISAFTRLSPVCQVRNPVIFVVYVGAILTTLAPLLPDPRPEPTSFTLWIAAFLWLTVLFSNFAEAYAEGKGKAQAENLKKSRRDMVAHLLRDPINKSNVSQIPAVDLRQDDIVIIKAGEFIPADGQIIEGIASVDESALTGESAPVIRESGGDRDAVTGGTRVLSDWIVVRVSTNPGEGYLDKMIALVEGAKRQKTPNEIALNILLTALTIIFLISCATILPFSQFIAAHTPNSAPVSVTVLIALFVCLAPTTISGLLSAIGIAGMNRLIQANVIATSGRAVEAAGDVNVLLLDKTGTITLGNRQAVAFYTAPGIDEKRLIEAALLSSMADDTPEGRSIVELGQRLSGTKLEMPTGQVTFIPFSADTRTSGVTIDDKAIMKGAGDSIEVFIKKLGGQVPFDLTNKESEIARQGGTPLFVTENQTPLGVIHLKDIVKVGIKDRLSSLRKMGIKSVMVTGDNPLTAAAIASEAGVDDFIAQATPETKLKYIRKMQTGGELVAMVGDGTNDAPALAQADVAVAMNSGTQAAKEASNMIDLDSDPTKLIEVVEIGKQLLMTRGSLTTFSLANDIAKYFAIIPAVFAPTTPALASLNIMGLSSPHNAILSAIIFNAFIIVFLIPLALRGVSYRPTSAANLLINNLTKFGAGGIITPFIGIKIIDLGLSFLAGGH